jgi:trans-aconitate methyltransferase
MLGARGMSQLDLHIEQKIAQRDSIDLAARRLAPRPGWIVEFGLGRGRSYSHLAARFPDREIYCFDRERANIPGWGPPADHVIYGDIATVLADPAVQARFRGRVILAHLDLAWGPATDARLHRLVLEDTHDWLLPGAWVLSDRAVPLEPAWHLTPLVASDEVGYAHRFHRYERRPAG